CWLGADTLGWAAATASGDASAPRGAVSSVDWQSAHHYELLVQDARGPFGPRYLTAIELADFAAAEEVLAGQEAHNFGGVLSERDQTRGAGITSWALVWRKLSESGPPSTSPSSIYVIGIDPPSGADAAALQEFNDFYTNIHVAESLAYLGYFRGTRYE